MLKNKIQDIDENNSNVCQEIINNFLSNYSKGEEIFNMVSHIIGAAIGVLVIILSIFLHHNIYGLISGIIFGICLIILYTMSSIYHGLSPKKIKAKKVFQILDHCSIFVLIAGSYTPFILCTLRKFNFEWSLIFFIFIWSLAILGVTLNAIDLKKYKIFSAICYLLMGWSIIVRVDVISKLLGTIGFSLLVAGGIAYSVGFIFYAVGKYRKWMHSVFHIFCLVGTVLHCICILKYAI